MNIYHRLLLSLLLINVVQLQAMDMINSMVGFFRTNPGLIKTVVIVATTLVLSETRSVYKMRSQEERLIMLLPKQKPVNRETTKSNSSFFSNEEEGDASDGLEEVTKRTLAEILKPLKDKFKYLELRFNKAFGETDEENDKKLLFLLHLISSVDGKLTLSPLREALEDESASRGTCDLARNKPPAGGAIRDDKAQKTTGSPSRQRPADPSPDSASSTT